MLIEGDPRNAQLARRRVTAPALCAAGATVIWTRHRPPPDLTGRIRAFAETRSTPSALGRDSIAAPEGIAATAAILDDLLARRTIPGRRAELSDDLDWVLAASGRAEVRRPGSR